MSYVASVLVRFTGILTAVEVFLITRRGNFVATELIISWGLIIHEYKSEDDVFCSEQRLDWGNLVRLAASGPERGGIKRVKSHAAVFPDACNTCTCPCAPDHLHLSGFRFAELTVTVSG